MHHGDITQEKLKSVNVTPMILIWIFAVTISIFLIIIIYYNSGNTSGDNGITNTIYFTTMTFLTFLFRPQQIGL